MKKVISVIICVCVLLGIALWGQDMLKKETVNVSIGGEVCWTISEGAEVRKGSELVRIKTLTGEIAAARATEDGTVKQMVVKIGDEIKSGDKAAIIEKVRK